jgi:hypothetical protein
MKVENPIAVKGQDMSKSLRRTTIPVPQTGFKGPHPALPNPRPYYTTKVDSPIGVIYLSSTNLRISSTGPSFTPKTIV